MINEVRVYDPDGNLKERITVFDYDAKPPGRLRLTTCRECKKPVKLYGTQKFCSIPCATVAKERRKKAHRDARRLERQAQSTRACQVCGKQTHRPKNCSVECLEISNRAVAMKSSDRVRFVNKAKREARK